MSIQQVAELLEDVKEHCPVLAPRMQPRHLLDFDLRSPQVMKACGPAQQKKLARLIEQLAQDTDTCAVCGNEGAAVAPAGVADAADEAPLMFTAQWTLDVQERLMVFQRAGYVCMKCRACLDTASFIQYGALRAGMPGVEEDKMSELIDHFLAVNQMTELHGDAAKAAFIHQLYCKAYSVHVLASALPGWRLACTKTQERGSTADKIRAVLHHALAQG